MSCSFKSAMWVSCIFAVSFIFSNYNHLEAAYGRWGAYNTERGAWGGNGGWWGDGNNDWYGEYGTPEVPYDNYGSYTNPYSPSAGFNYDDYYYNNEYPYSGDTVDGAGLYLNFR
jgi:hypothetical protein